VKAFPNVTGEKGMDLRDYFAAKAMQGIVSSSHPNDNISESVCASWAYQIADAMMRAREKDEN
jgi:hypothetical protein